MTAVTIPAQDLPIVRKYAKQVELGGRSNVHTDPKTREEMLKDNQYVGQAGEAALSIYLTGYIFWYGYTRKLKAKNIYKGDGGVDLVGSNLDIKTTRMRYGRNYKYHLYVREKEYHPKTRYVLGLMEMNQDDTVDIIGYADSDELPAPVNGLRSIPMDKLHNPERLKTKEQQIEYFYWMLEQCSIHGWVHLAALVQKQLDLIDGI